MLRNGGRITRTLARGLASLCSIVLSLSLVLLAAGTAAGRWRLWPVTHMGAHTSVGHDAVVFVVPVPVAQIADGDLVVMSRDKKHAALYRVEHVLDTATGKIELSDEQGRLQPVTLSTKVWRVSREVPYAGVLLRLLAGPVQAVLLVGGGIALIARAESRRHRNGDVSVGTVARAAT
jgi:hypothetical protein